MIIIMDPNNLPLPSSSPQIPPSGQHDASQFDFIMNPQQPQKKSLIPGGPKTRMVIVGLIIATVVIILLAVVLSMFNSGDSTTEALVKIAQQQNEIIRIADDGTKKAGSTEAKKLATMSYMTIKTDQNNLISYLAKQKRKVKAKELGLLVDKKTDSSLATASSNGRYDEIFTQIIIEQLKNYQSSLQNASTNVGKNGKEILAKSYENVNLIIKDNSNK